MESQAAADRIDQPHPAVDRLERYVNNLSRWLSWIAGIALISMLVLTVADIIGIKIFASPVPGAIEVVAFMAVVVIGFAIAYTQAQHGHIAVDFIVMKLPPRANAIINPLMLILAMALFVFLAWRTLDYGQNLMATGEVSMTQRIPFYPFIFALAFCFLVTFLVLVMEFIKAILKVGKIWTR
ncbi:MAG: TRAP transporter small permease [Dehalococcoidales bacterium]|nr:TRAP transporter small permease [Dehalococcoidales bacterium]